MTRDTTHEYVCVECGVSMKGRENKAGEVRATNAPSSGDLRLCLCLSTSCRRKREARFQELGVTV